MRCLPSAVGSTTYHRGFHRRRQPCNLPKNTLFAGKTEVIFFFRTLQRTIRLRNRN